MLLKLYYVSFNPLPDDNMLALSKLKAFADSKFSVTQNIKFVYHRIENIVGKEKKLWLPAFFPFQNLF